MAFKKLPNKTVSVLKVGPYELLDTIGRGSFGKVKLARRIGTTNVVAVKILCREKMKKMDVELKVTREIEILPKLNHPHIAKLYHVLTSKNELFLFMEYVPGGELFDYIINNGRLSTEQSRKFFQQLISAVDYCHRQGIVHRDLKPENVLLDKNNNLKIIDFGLANALRDGIFLKTSCGSPNYASPELVSGILYAGPEVDIWACGVMLYVFLTGRMPFDHENIQVLFKKIKSGSFYVPGFMGDSVADLLKHMLTPDSVQRATMKEIINHPWFTIDLPLHLFPPVDDLRLDPFLIDPILVGKIAQVYGLPYNEVKNRLVDERDPRDPMKMAYLAMHDRYYSFDNGKGELTNRRNSSFDSGYRGSYHSSMCAAELRTGSLEKEMEDVLKISESNAMPTRCENYNGPRCTANSKHYCNLNCELCSKLGAADCVFKQRLPAITSCDTCSNYKKSTCPFADARDNSIEDLVKPSIGEQKKPIEDRKSKLDIEYLSQVRISQHKLMKRSRWHLGIRSHCNAEDVMKEIFLCLKVLDFEWICEDPYHVIVRKRASESQNRANQKSITFSLQLYKADHQSFLLDFMDATDRYTERSQTGEAIETNFSSETMIFLDMCASIVKHLAKAG